MDMAAELNPAQLQEDTELALMMAPDRVVARLSDPNTPPEMRSSIIEGLCKGKAEQVITHQAFLSLLEQDLTAAERNAITLKLGMDMVLLSAKEVSEEISASEFKTLSSLRLGLNDQLEGTPQQQITAINILSNDISFPADELVSRGLKIIQEQPRFIGQFTEAIRTRLLQGGEEGRQTQSLLSNFLQQPDMGPVADMLVEQGLLDQQALPVPLLLTQLEANDANKRYIALRTLRQKVEAGTQLPENAMAKVATLLRDTPDNALEATTILARCGRRANTPAILDILLTTKESDNILQRLFALQALSAIDPQALEPHERRMLQNAQTINFALLKQMSQEPDQQEMLAQFLNSDVQRRKIADEKLADARLAELLRENPKEMDTLAMSMNNLAEEHIANAISEAFPDNPQLQQRILVQITIYARELYEAEPDEFTKKEFPTPLVYLVERGNIQELGLWLVRNEQIAPKQWEALGSALSTPTSKLVAMRKILRLYQVSDGDINLFTKLLLLETATKKMKKQSSGKDKKLLLKLEEARTKQSKPESSNQSSLLAQELQGDDEPPATNAATAQQGAQALNSLFASTNNAPENTTDVLALALEEPDKNGQVTINGQRFVVENSTDGSRKVYTEIGGNRKLLEPPTVQRFNEIVVDTVRQRIRTETVVDAGQDPFMNKPVEVCTAVFGADVAGQQLISSTQMNTMMTGMRLMNRLGNLSVEETNGLHPFMLTGLYLGDGKLNPQRARQLQRLFTEQADTIGQSWDLPTLLRLVRIWDKSGKYEYVSMAALESREQELGIVQT